MRLVDADELIEHAWRDKLDSRELIDNMIRCAPTVPVAEKVSKVITKLDVDIAFYKAIRATGEASGMYHAKRYLQELLKEISE